ncbi:MAG: helix-turn-helix transcriptional regulator [Xanthomonadales bacterium]|nr:helix-turn-helix transcriptional regulator [Xanthomonadales bacterium]
MKTASLSVCSNHTLRAVALLAAMIKAARKERNMSQAALAERLGVSLLTVRSIEKGNLKVAVGTVFEAAAIVGIPLLAKNQRELDQLTKSLAALTTILPQRSGRKTVIADDDF